MAMIQTNACRYCRQYLHALVAASSQHSGLSQALRGSDTPGWRPAGHTPAQAATSGRARPLRRCPTRTDESTLAQECPGVIDRLPGRWWPM